MKIVPVILIVIGVIVIVALLIGTFLPREHVAARSARFGQPPEVLWGALTNFAALPTWMPEFQKVERVADMNGHPVWMHTGRRFSAPMEVVEFSPKRRFAMRIADPRLPFGGTWTYDIAPAEGGSVVTITEHGEIRTPLFRFMARFVFGYTSTMDGYLKALGKKFGETVTPGPGVAS
jgi:uncharacterized protein YndB with AHSA1/START domain